MAKGTQHRSFIICMLSSLPRDHCRQGFYSHQGTRMLRVEDADYSIVYRLRCLSRVRRRRDSSLKPEKKRPLKEDEDNLHITPATPHVFSVRVLHVSCGSRCSTSLTFSSYGVHQTSYTVEREGWACSDPCEQLAYRTLGIFCVPAFRFISRYAYSTSETITGTARTHTATLPASIVRNACPAKETFVRLFWLSGRPFLSLRAGPRWYCSTAHPEARGPRAKPYAREGE